MIPSNYRNKVLSVAHDGLAGHLGINKTHDRILLHFFWPGLKWDVMKFCKTCHVCQVTGKPNQPIPPAPLHPIPVVGEPFEHIILACVGPLPRSKRGPLVLINNHMCCYSVPRVCPSAEDYCKSSHQSINKVLCFWPP